MVSVAAELVNSCRAFNRSAVYLSRVLYRLRMMETAAAEVTYVFFSGRSAGSCSEAITDHALHAVSISCISATCREATLVGFCHALRICLQAPATSVAIAHLDYLHALPRYDGR